MEFCPVFFGVSESEVMTTISESTNKTTQQKNAGLTLVKKPIIFLLERLDSQSNTHL
jgi:hypothetical protein